MFPEPVAKLTHITISCPGSGRREVSVVGMQAAGKETDNKGCKNMIVWDSTEGVSIPESVAIKSRTDESLPTSEFTGSKKLPDQVAMLQFDGEDCIFKDDFILPQSPLGSPTLLENEDPPSPSTTLVDDESISSDSTSVDPCALNNRPFASADKAVFNALGTETKYCSSQETLHAQAHPEPLLQGKGHHIVSNGEAIFTDQPEFYYGNFAIKLRLLSSENSENSMCVERFLGQSEAEWFSGIRKSRLGTPRSSSPSSLAGTPKPYHQNAAGEVQFLDIEQMNRFVQKPGSHKMTALRRALLIPIRDFWPVYSLLIALVRMKPH